ncbi:MAG: hypothetical protein GY797_17110, partial [Deltaproteobacteria bacterium]|nr:hypothetical protein [Deltaproteobacteria bacterium]
MPPQVWPVSVREGGQQAHATGPGQAHSTGSGQAHSTSSGQAWRVPLPGLIFVGHEGDYWLWAVKERPASIEAPLYVAPVPNVSGKGVCHGNVHFPKAGCSTIWAAVEHFFSSRFNRDLSKGKSRAYPECVVEQWQALHAARAKVYPLDDLVEAGGNLGAILNA